MRVALLRFVALLNHDFCPNANRWVYWLQHPVSILGIAAGISLACALCLNPQAFAAVGGLAAILVLGLVWPIVALRGLSSTLKWERSRGREGESVRARLILKNRCPWPVWGLTLEGGFRSDAPAVAMARVAGWSEVEFSWEFTPRRRGVYPQTTPSVVTGFPFGLWQAKHAVEHFEQLIVWPGTMPLDMLPDLTDSRIAEERLTDRRAGDCGDLMGTRLFRQGDSLRRIHWGQSARHQRFIVTERQSGMEGSVSVMVDIDAAHHTGDHKDSSFEWTLRIAASICECLSDGHLHVECWLGSECVSLSGANGWNRLLDRMALLPDGGVIVTTGRKTRADENSQDVAAVARPRQRTSGAFEILCTTELGWQHLRQASTVRRDRRVVVLKSALRADRETVSAAIETRHANHECPMSQDWSESGDRSGHHDSRRTETFRAVDAARPWVLVESHGDVPTSFRQQWRRACRVA